MYSQGEVAVPALVSALADPDGGVRRAATGALQSLLPGAEARLDTWLDAIQEQRGQLTRDTLRELASGEDELVVLLLRLKSGSAAVRRAASIALTEIIPALREVRVPNLFGSGETTFDYSTLTPETLTQLLRDQPYAFEFLSQLHLPDRTLNFRGLSQRGAEQLPELIAKVRDRQMLLAQAEGELATASVEQLEPATVMETEAQRTRKFILRRIGAHLAVAVAAAAEAAAPAQPSIQIQL